MRRSCGAPAAVRKPNLGQAPTCRTRALAHRFLPACSRYVKHRDALPYRAGRKLTAILYLNEGWQREHGGELRLWPAVEDNQPPAPPLIVAPLADRLVIFISSLEHEVLPSWAHRSVFREGPGGWCGWVGEGGGGTGGWEDSEWEDSEWDDLEWGDLEGFQVLRQRGSAKQSIYSCTAHRPCPVADAAGSSTAATYAAAT